MIRTQPPPLLHPFQAIPYRRRLALFLAFFALTLLIIGVFQVLDMPMRTVSAPQGIISYELAGNLSNAQAIIASWDARARLHAALGLGLDFLFMPVYAITISLSCRVGSPGLGPRPPLAGVAWRGVGLGLGSGRAARRQ